ncbi:hypothetical protein TPB0596_06330 [Tsukamurella pulmonis]|nr:hypothetical protein TPB0596_06330 [Tsukamurella pulmonis]
MVVEVLGDVGAERDADRAAHAEHGRHERDRARDLARVQLVAHERDAHGHQAHREALERAAHDGEQQRVRERADQRARDEAEQAGEQDKALAVHVAEAAGDGHRDRGGEQRRGDDPRGVVGRGVEQVRQLADERHHQRLHEGGEESAEAQDGDEEAVRRSPGAGLSEHVCHVADRSCRIQLKQPDAARITPTPPAVTCVNVVV